MTVDKTRPHSDRCFDRRDALLGIAAGGFALGTRAFAQSEAEKGPVVWLDMDQAELDAAYDQRVWAPNMDRLNEQRDVRNLAARARLDPPVRFAYGPTPTEMLDVYRTSRDNAPIHVFFHGGTWRFGTAADYAYMAEAFVHRGSTLVIPDFSVVDDVEGGLSVLGRQVRDAVAWVYENAEQFGGDRERIFVSGHSSGGHLAGVVLTTDWLGDYGLPADLVKGGLCASGMFDLEPVRLSWRNSYLGLTDEAVHALSPQRHLDRLRAPLIVAYGTYETPEFQRQSRDFAAAVQAAGKPIELMVATGFNHLEIRETLSNAYGFLGHAALEQMGLTSA